MQVKRTAPRRQSPLTLLPRHWSRAYRQAVAIALSVTALVLFLWLVGIPLSWLPAPIGPAASQFAEGARMTMALTLAAGVSGLLLGMLTAVGRLSPVMPVRLVCSLYVWAIRGTPLLIQVLFVFLALPALVPSLQLSDFCSAAVALAFNSGAYHAEALRAGILAVPQGQRDAARSLGMPPWQTLRYIVLPQSLRIAMPPVVNNLVALLKDSSLAYVIGVVELSNIGNRIQAATFEPVPVLMTVAGIYLVLTTVLTQISAAIERHLDVQ